MHESNRAGSSPSRRRFLATASATATVGVAGCSALLGEDATWEDGGPSDRDRWTVTFQDAFDAGELDRGVWQNGFGHNPLVCPVHDGPNICAVEDHASVDRKTDRLVLEATEETPPVPDDERPRSGPDPEYSVGAVHTEGSFEQEFGYFEVKARIPTEPGTLPACWFYVDISEHSWREPHIYEKRGGDGGHRVAMGAGWEDEDGELQRTGALSTENPTIAVDPPTHEAFRIYALEWGPESLTWYVDGEQRGYADDPGIAAHLPGQPVYWIINHSVFEAADWVGDPANATFPSAHEIEWVRAWQRDDWR